MLIDCCGGGGAASALGALEHYHKLVFEIVSDLNAHDACVPTAAAGVEAARFISEMNELCELLQVDKEEFKEAVGAAKSARVKGGTGVEW